MLVRSYCVSVIGLQPRSAGVNTIDSCKKHLIRDTYHSGGIVVVCKINYNIKISAVSDLKRRLGQAPACEKINRTKFVFGFAIVSLDFDS